MIANINNKQHGHLSHSRGAVRLVVVCGIPQGSAGFFEQTAPGPFGQCLAYALPEEEKEKEALAFPRGRKAK